VERDPICVKAVMDWNSAAIHDPVWDFAELWWPEKDLFQSSLRSAYARQVTPGFIQRQYYVLFAGSISARAREVPKGWHKADAPPRRVKIWNEGMKQLRRLAPLILNQDFR